MNQDARELQKMSITICNEARTAVTEALRNAGIGSTRFIPCDAKEGHINIEFCLTGQQAEKVIDTVLHAATLRARGCPDGVVVASLGPQKGPQPCCKPETIASDRDETPYAEE